MWWSVLDLSSIWILGWNWTKSQCFGQNYKFYYVDSDGDVISITSNEDLREAQKSGVNKLLLTNNQNDANDKLNSSILNCSTVMSVQPTAESS